MLDEKPLDGYSAKEYAQKVAYLPQHPPITDGVTVRELVMFGRYPGKAF
ncbi:ferric aerobactin ABC transporter ATPase component [Vibrio maritimus]|uniref:Ferric aerobactin ABC transporter ATPase component n=1 Tax=Vibrio maritimus TaxID=990268 RepID=A0A090RQ75_9VIBR|nr:ferric aerobactin ABC transporter ATPase component [Vibrio maritimus]